VVMGMISREVRGRAHFLLGLLHDIGKVILNYRFSDYFREVLRIAGEQNRSIYDNEPPDGSTDGRKEHLMFKMTNGTLRRLQACAVALLLAALVTVGFAGSGGTGADRFEPTKLDWLVLQLNAKGRLQSPFGSGMVEYGAAPPDTVVIRLISSTLRHGLGERKEVIEISRKVVLAEAEKWGFVGWVQTKENVLAPGESSR